jgi:hypothetical protein
MHNPPTTRADAQKYRYGVWAGEPNGYRFKHYRCAYEVPMRYSPLPLFVQCSRRDGHGPDGLYCRQHAAIVGRGTR